MSIYQRGKVWWYEFVDHGERYWGAIGKVSKTMAREVETRKKPEVAEGRYKPPSKKPSLRLDEFIEDYFAYYRTNRKPRSVKRHEVSWQYRKSRPVSPTCWNAADWGLASKCLFCTLLHC